MDIYGGTEWAEDAIEDLGLELRRAARSKKRRTPLPRMGSSGELTDQCAAVHAGNFIAALIDSLCDARPFP
jgi:hypothetical protein